MPKERFFIGENVLNERTLLSIGEIIYMTGKTELEKYSMIYGVIGLYSTLMGAIIGEEEEEDNDRP